MNDLNMRNAELYHHGVKGMKWGVRKKRDMKVAKRFARAGKLQGKSDYYRDQANAAYKKHDDNAKVLDKMAKKYESQGKYIKAQASRKAAEALRARGSNVKARGEIVANKYLAKAQKRQEKAKTYATKKRVDLGKKTVNAIMKDSHATGYNRAQKIDNLNKDYQARKTLGEDGYRIYNQIRGR